MIHSLAQSQPESALLMHPVYPLLFAALVIGWAWVIEKFDKDADYYYLPFGRYWLNLIHLAAGAVAMLAILLIPWFGLGLLVGLAIMVGDIVGYAYYRNLHVPEHAQWSLSLQDIMEQIQQRQQARAQRHARMSLHGPDKKPRQVPVGDNPHVPAHETLEDVLEFVFARDGELLDLAVDNQRAGAFARVDGVRYPYPEAIDPQLMRDLIDYLKETAGLNVEDRRKRQTSRIFITDSEYGERELEIETAGSTRGLTLTLTVDPSQRTNLPLEQLGFSDAQLKRVRGTIEEKNHGVVIVAGPRRQGITTTLYSFLQEHDPYTASVVTLEDEPLTELEGVHHNRLGEGASPEEFNKTLAGLLRGDPHVIMLSHVGDDKTTKQLAQNAGEVRIYFPLMEEDTFSALRSWVKLVGDRQQAAESLSMVVAQRLVRKLCTTCRVAYKPDAAALKKFNLPADKVSQLYRSSGKIRTRQQREGDEPEICPRCHGLAYRGRVGVFEVMALDDEARRLIAAGEEDQLRAHLRKQKMLWLQESALQKVIQGVTDIKEVTRVFSGGERKAQAGESADQAGQAGHPEQSEQQQSAKG